MSPQFLLFCAYGTDDHQNECKYAALRFFRIAAEATVANTTLVIYTDRPQAYEGFDFGPLRHRLVPIPAHQFQAWKGPHDFVYRVKLESLRHFCRQESGLVLLLDTDTHLRVDLAPLFADIQAGQAVMHLCEGPIQAQGEFAEWHAFLASRSFPDGIQMWNSGVVGLPTEKVEEFMDQALGITDQIYAAFPRHICEQFAFSYCLQARFVLAAADRYIHHYWALKEFRGLLREFFKRKQGSLTELALASDAIVPEHIEADRRRFKRQFPPRRLWYELTGRRWKIEDYFRRL